LGEAEAAHITLTLLILWGLFRFVLLVAPRLSAARQLYLLLTSYLLAHLTPNLNS
jgi:hypothetical protein